MADPRRVAQCRAWNADPAHQVLAGQARAAHFTPDFQARAGEASSAAFSARFRASHGSPPLSAEAVRRYLTSDEVRGPLGLSLPLPLRRIVFAAWCAGQLVGISHWLEDGTSEPASLSLGSLGDSVPGGHVWGPWDTPGWAVCSTCWRAAFCPVCRAGWDTDPILSRLPRRVCARHGAWLTHSP
jgi:hypothetical protein